MEYSAEAVAAALSDAMGRDLAPLAEMGANGRSWMEREFSWASVAERTLAVYRWLDGGGPRPACVEE